MVIYEQPLNEKLRLFLRLEHLIKRFNYHVDGICRENSQAAVMILLDLYNLTVRFDLKGDILKELDRQSIVMKKRVTEDPEESTRWQPVLENHAKLSDQLYTIHGQLGQQLRTHNFISVLRQRSGLPGGVNTFDSPLFRYWLTKSNKEQIINLKQWVKPYKIANDAIGAILKLIRDSHYEKESEVIAKHGFYQATLDFRTNYHLLRIGVSKDADYYPEISAGKQRFSVRFVNVQKLEERGKQKLEDVKFNLMLCSF